MGYMWLQDFIYIIIYIYIYIYACIRVYVWMHNFLSGYYII